MPDLTERRASDIKLESIEKKLEEHSGVLNQMRDTLQQIAVQNVHIQSLQAMQSEMRGDINEVYDRINKITAFQSACPRASVSNIWKTIISISLVMAGAFATHIFGGGK